MALDKPQFKEPLPKLTAEELAAVFEAGIKKREPEPLREMEPAREAVRPAEVREAPKPAPAKPMQYVEPLIARVPLPRTKSERLVEIEKIMSEGIESVYTTLPAAVQESVKREGEKTASAIEQLVESGKAAAKKVLILLRAWLEKIPGVNAFFLEQESKIKTDRIMAIARKTRGG
ncbi:MAG: hypothetical protein HY462_00385 [Parcubacteria group bacterium]|nr:hypothetical protein [Parcubacteria group bacterium]